MLSGFDECRICKYYTRQAAVSEWLEPCVQCANASSNTWNEDVEINPLFMTLRVLTAPEVVFGSPILNAISNSILGQMTLGYSFPVRHSMIERRIRSR